MKMTSKFTELEKYENFQKLINMIIHAFNTTMEEVHKENEQPKQLRKYAPIFTKLACKLSEISKYYDVYEMNDDYINSLNKWIEDQYEYMLIFVN